MSNAHDMTQEQEPPLPPNGTRNRYHIEIRLNTGETLVWREDVNRNARTLERCREMRATFLTLMREMPEVSYNAVRIVARDAQGRKVVIK